MKRILLVFGLLAVTMLGYAQEKQETKRVAILEIVDKEGKLTYSQKLMLRSNLAKAVTNTEGFEAYDRTDIDAILNEQDFQRTGMVSDAQIKKMGEMTGAAYILVAEGAIADEANMFVTAKILNVETGRIVMTESAVVSMSTKNMHRGCANLASNLFRNLAPAGIAAIAAIKSAGQNKATADEKKQAEEAAAAKKAEQEALAAQAKEQKQLAKEQQRLAKEQQQREEAERAKFYINRIGGKTFEYRGKTMDDKAYEMFLQNNCERAYAQYQIGKKFIKAGWGTFIPGIILMAGGATCLIMDNVLLAPDYYDGSNEYSSKGYNSKGYNSEILYSIGVAGFSVGGTCTVVSIPLLGVGYAKRNNANKIYNKECSSPLIQPLSLSVVAGKRTIGVALNF